MERNEIKALVRRNIIELEPYSTARDEYQGTLGTFLDANESPYPTGYNRYPDPHQKALKEKISRIKGVSASRIFVGNGSDEAIDVLMRVFCRPGKDNIVAISPSYGMYSVAADINDVEVRKVQLSEDFSLNVDDMLAACDGNTRLMFLCSPNNPSGNAFPVEQLVSLADNFKGMMVVDEAYVDFSSLPSLLGQLDRLPNLVVLQTLSKARGMAALRLGLAFADEYVIKLMSMVKYPYNINAAAQKLALDMLDEDISPKVEQIKAQREMLAGRLGSFGCVKKLYPSDANFILIKVDDPNRLYEHFLSRGIIVRNRNRVKGCEGCLRITVGTPDENVKLLEAVEAYEKGDIR